MRSKRPLPLSGEDECFVGARGISRTVCQTRRAVFAALAPASRGAAGARGRTRHDTHPGARPAPDPGDRSCGSALPVSSTISNLAREINVAVDTMRRWIATLCTLHHGFLVRPWFRNVAKSLRKEPKWYLRDWSGVRDPGQRAETFVACHLLKAVEMWEDLGFGAFQLRYLRDKQKREVDFLVVRDDRPWFMVEVKAGDTSLSPALSHFREQIDAEHCFQVANRSALHASELLFAKRSLCRSRPNLSLSAPVTGGGSIAHSHASSRCTLGNGEPPGRRGERVRLSQQSASRSTALPNSGK